MTTKTATELRKEKIAEWDERTWAPLGGLRINEAAVYADMIERPDVALEFFRIPERMHGGIARWVLFGFMPGGFLQAVLRHDLMDAARTADDQNQKLLYEYCFLMYNAMPSASHGPDCLKTWKGIWPAGEDDAP